MKLCFESSSRRSDRISDTSEACNVGVKRLGSRIDICSPLLSVLCELLGSGGKGAGEEGASLAGVP